MDKELFIREFSTAIHEGNAAIFAGAGTSVSAGFVNWKELVRPFSVEIKLDIEKETDLIGVTQYYINTKRNRAKVNQRIFNTFLSREAETDVMNLLTRLPISTYWTTNYDTVIEKGLENNHRKGDIKRKETNLTYSVPDRDAVVYKMHGDVMSPEEAVISKDDYARYSDDHSLFITALHGDLVSKTFLFVGFSFEDPNLDSILGKLHVLLKEDTREHFCIQKKVSKSDFYDPEEAEEVINDKFSYALIKQDLKIEDLRRYGIETVLVDEYSEIPELILRIEKEYLKNTIFISGSISSYDTTWSEESVNKYCYDLSKYLVSQNYKIISGFGLGVGSSIINGALDEIYKSKYRHVNEHLGLFPFPQYESGEKSLQERWTENRKEMIRSAGVCIFIFGNKKDANGEIVDATGMLEEFYIASETGKIIIPIGSTGFTAKKIFDRMKASDEFRYLDKYWDILESGDDSKKVFSAIDSIIKGT